MQLDRFFSIDLAFHSLHGFQSTFLGRFHCRRQIGEIPVKYYLCLKTETTDAVHHQLKGMVLDALGMRTQQVIKLGFIIETTEIKNIK